jgi:dihydrofolate synthase/folylpolyglutamate synthase
MTERGLRAAGYRTGRYTSPHLIRIEERFAIDGSEVTTDALRGAAATVRDVAERLREEGVLESSPTFFECATAIAFVLFADARVDIAVLEVGLGGRLDATNVVTPLAAAITSIDFDHQAQLGSTISSIAREKAGVIKPGIPVVCGPLPPEAERVVREVSKAAGATYVNAMNAVEVDAVLAGARLSLEGGHQRANAAVAVALLQELGGAGIAVPPEALRAAISDVSWPARLERFEYRGASIWLDAAHNAAGARALRTFLTEVGWTDCALVFGAMRDKDVSGMLKELLPLCAVVICTTAQSPRAMRSTELGEISVELAGSTVRVETIPEPRVALARACELERSVVAAGSIFLIGPLRDILR